ncbi:hypothetical protein L4D04_06010 [Photobacterium angustum]|uniref:Uncharacterized protein n=1 Tax=Photobacterium angustum (strain S14 / CCUG 15956) TaxID=314292 RepID=Q1ZUG6_PHOAS|nr:hypothetical protein [Photobacterium angustum]EAS66444.1 hypothetical protein VAS14_14044 [Photobacterium angustum S14]
MEEKYLVSITAKESVQESRSEGFLIRLKALWNSDPKPIFDHFRNIGIVAVIGLSSGFIREINLLESSSFLGNVLTFTWITLFILSATLMVINTRYAQISLNKFFFNQEKPRGFSKRFTASVVVWAYSLILFAVIVMYSVNSQIDKINNYSESVDRSKEVYLTTESINKLIEENERLRNTMQEFNGEK